ncbi:hypothetical protein [Fusibacter ferrireducens]|uniref:Uncharacterized protein n=1 Tax=Fusibacter ferrireducens TaxID=2785058 RepID=A0ABR9ZP86_9FIRM|nr:hypothetical protein [Fusibacter ferrireducens]MBF4692287.1 hypothetical protein [Fusibacter ferrireducens]
MDKMIEKVKKSLEALMMVFNNPRLIDDLSDEINIKLLEISELKNRNSKLSEMVQELQEEAYLVEATKWELHEQKQTISERVDKMLDEAIRGTLGYDDQVRFKQLEFMDPEGWCIYRASQEILKLDVYKEFIVEDTMGWFEESDGHELKNYLEIAAFGDCTYKVIGSMHEALESYTIDYASQEYKVYEASLYALTARKLIDKLYEAEPQIKLQFIQNYMAMPEKTLIEDRNEQSQDSMKTIIGEVLDEEMEI